MFHVEGPPAGAAERVAESARDIPIAYDVDVVVAGGSSGAVAAAVEAAKAGAKVFVAAPRPYLGEDLCGTMRLWLEAGETPRHPLAAELYGGTHPARPMYVKRVLDQALLRAGVEFLYGCLVTDVLADKDGRPAGIIMANRAGRQVVRAHVLIDATDRAWVARMAGAAMRPYPPGPHVFCRWIAGGVPYARERVTARATGLKLEADGSDSPGLLQHYYYTPGGSPKAAYDLLACELTIPMRDGSFRSLAEAEQVARDATFDARQVDTSEFLWQVPPDPMKGKARLAGSWPASERVELDVFRPAGLARVYVLGGCADMPRDAARMLLRPSTLMEVGARIGRAAAAEAAGTPRPEAVRPLGPGPPVRRSGEVRESLLGIRPTQRGLPVIRSEERGIPVLGSYDVVVIGGGTSGAPAAIGAARQAARTLVVEYQHALGGIGTTGLIGNYYYGFKGGFTQEVIAGVSSLKGILAEARMEWWRREIRRAGGEIWLGCLGCGALVDGPQVRGAVVATPEGRGVVRAKVVIDATGNADIAAAAGAECVHPSDREPIVQGTGLAPRDLAMSRNSTDWTVVEDTDMLDTWFHLVHAKERFQDAYDLATLIGTRERRRIAGEFELSPLDIVTQRTYPDTIALAQSHFDSHGFLIHPLFLLEPELHQVQFTANIPYRCLIPRGLEGILVIGLGASVDHDAMALARMQADLQNCGYAAGAAAAMAAALGGRVRAIGVKELQRHLASIGIVPPSVLTDGDSYPLASASLPAAVDALAGGSKSLERAASLAQVFAHAEAARPLLRDAYRKARDKDAQVRYAQVLAFLGDRTGVPALIAEIESAHGLDEGFPYRSWGCTGSSRLDGLIVALGCAGDRRAVGPLLRKLDALTTRGDFSHVRALAGGLESLRDPAAAAPLAALLGKHVQGTPMSGHAIQTLEDARRWCDQPAREGRSRYFSLRELVVARALYRCGDHEGLGRRILGEYTRDLRGHFARHAMMVLEQGPP